MYMTNYLELVGAIFVSRKKLENTPWSIIRTIIFIFRKFAPTILSCEQILVFRFCILCYCVRISLYQSIQALMHRSQASLILVSPWNLQEYLHIYSQDNFKDKEWRARTSMEKIGIFGLWDPLLDPMEGFWS